MLTPGQERRSICVPNAQVPPGACAGRRPEREPASWRPVAGAGWRGSWPRPAPRHEPSPKASAEMPGAAASAPGKRVDHALGGLADAAAVAYAAGTARVLE